MRRNNKVPERKIRKWLRILWVLLITGGVLFYLCNRQYFTQEAIAAYLFQHRQQAWLLYFGLCILRGIFLLPSTPFLFAGILIFKDSPLMLFGVFMLSIWVVAAFIYYAAGYLRFSGLQEAPKLQRIQQGLQHKQGFWLILGWAFMPFTPTDLVCYAAGLLRIRFWHFILPLLLGEAVICALYIMNGRLIFS
ncbi:VTT domain-containing protein [Niabella sp. CC-SYL272]|uniref:TVP38/TMEM64 family protein n=1 Tax=Niabella agricola TaxID=2891571 RepID=UPI001F264CD5|nr:VTT domain-containing protein [Niabella agricola]MCF3108261.1 VTT domain-containing protein [Niabella agricola]